MDFTRIVAITPGEDFDAAARNMGWDNGPHLLESLGEPFNSLDPKTNFVQLQDEDGDDMKDADLAVMELVGEVTIWFTMGESNGSNRWYPIPHKMYKDEEGFWYQGDGSF